MTHCCSQPRKKRFVPGGVVCFSCESSSNESEKESKYFSAVSKTVNKEVDAAVNGQKKMADKEDLRAHRNKLSNFRYLYTHLWCQGKFKIKMKKRK